MKPEEKSRKLLGITRSKAKMHEYHIAVEDHIQIYEDPAKLFILTVGMLGDIAASLNRGTLAEEDYQAFQEGAIFTAEFFDAYENSKLNDLFDPYTQLLGATSFYLANLPGSAFVLAKRFTSEELFGEGIENLLVWLLRGDYQSDFGDSEGQIGFSLNDCFVAAQKFFITGESSEDVFRTFNALRNFSYEYGSPRQLLLADAVVAVIRLKYKNSSWYSLPLYSDYEKSHWMDMLGKEGSIKELWPAQHLLGKANVFRGVSAVVQMPTSSGKTKAVELILRSTFFERGSLAVIVAPFRALCHEIRDDLSYTFDNENIDVEELTDAMIGDFEITKFFGGKKIVVATPEKLLYILRLMPEIASSIDLTIFDEGHQFDSGKRGITYELLLTSLREFLPEKCQKVLISAVINNATAVGEWLNGNGNVVTSDKLLPATKSVGFVSWLTALGQIQFVTSKDHETIDFFVPRVIERKVLPAKARERKDRYFPDKKKSQSVAIYLGLKLAVNGGVAIFCGRKDSVITVCETLNDLHQRDAIDFPPVSYTDAAETQRLSHLSSLNLGHNAPVSVAAEYGIFSHQGDTPQGMRLAIEHAMRLGKIRFVVCTSTLAQGVNLPIKYLIISGVRQGEGRIKVRDFQNLVGRAGRAGMHTEGSVLFSDPSVFDKKDDYNEKWRWVEAKELLDPSNSEPCISNITSLFGPLTSENGNFYIEMKALDFTKAYIKDRDVVATWSEKIGNRYADKGFTKGSISRQISWRADIISAIESFLLSHMKSDESEISRESVANLAEGTLAFHIADAETKPNIQQLFVLLADNINVSIQTKDELRFFKRTLYGLHDAKLIEKWIGDNLPLFIAAGDHNEVLRALWPLMTKLSQNTTAAKLSSPDALIELATFWMQGAPYHKLLSMLKALDVKLIWGTKFRELKVEHIVNICEGGFAFDGALLIGAISEYIDQMDFEEKGAVVENLHFLLKIFKYGLPSQAAISIYELGVTDRVIVQELSKALGLSMEQKHEIKDVFRQNSDLVRSVIDSYPSYFQAKLNGLLGEPPQVPDSA